MLKPLSELLLCFCLYSLIFEDVFAIPISSILRFIISLLCAGTRTSPPVAKAFPSPFPGLSSDLWLDSKVELAILNLTKQFYLRTSSGGSDEDVDNDDDNDDNNGSEGNDGDNDWFLCQLSSTIIIIVGML